MDHGSDVRGGLLHGGKAETQDSLPAELNTVPFPAMSKTDDDAIEAWMNRYCADHPLHTIFDGTEALVLEVQQRGTRQ